MGSKPKVVQQDPEGDARRAAEKATAESNAKKAMRRTGSSMGSSMSVLGSGEDQGGSWVSRGLRNVASDVLSKKSKLGGG